MCNNAMRSRWNIASPWKHITKFELPQLVHLLQIKYVNVFCEMQQLRLRRLNFITLIRGKLTKFSENLTPKHYPPTGNGSFYAILSTKYHII